MLNNLAVFMKKYTVVSSIAADFKCGIDVVWDKVTSLSDYKWRSDINYIEVLGKQQFIEYSNKGIKTYFKTTAFIEHKYWEFELENKNIKSLWKGVFSFKNGRTTVYFTEEITAKNIFLIPFIKSFIKKQQALYIRDLKRALYKKGSNRIPV